MTKYNQITVGNNVLITVTDQSIYFEYNTVIDAFALALTYTEFETLYTNRQTQKLTNEISIDTTEDHIHIISNVLTVTIPSEDIETIYNFYKTIKPELQDPGRKAILVWKNETQIAETKYASKNAVETVVESLQSKYTDDYKIEIRPIQEFQNK